ncbi:alpha-L-fucosidase [Mucisphaera calidilacus]|uniref:alpha-L-fucosidase n=1 Tax=Mucisphaera calidilacus TaxID=2527982 RepID=A0A518BWZ8_9BACT|nr:alpha-L-fucosidase [Mucisphaera calidilacus]QDU71499.1 Alpha-L-fucosidase [Mucisphaera calidilacus]
MSDSVPCPRTATPRPGQAWFDDARFGIFIHWGVYAVSARGEWEIYRDAVPKEVYRGYAERFVADRFDPEAWAEQVAASGAKYVVLTAKHHDGFCMFDSRHTDWKVTRTPLGRDVVAEVADAVRAVGLRFGVYYSIWDLWHAGLDGGMAGIDAEGHAGFSEDPDAWRPSAAGIAYLHGQVEELLTGYGKIDLLWFDVRRAGAEAYDGARLMRRIRALQPDILVNDRLVLGDAEIEDPDLLPDIITPENKIPPRGLRDASGRPVRWESCMCLNEHWGYCRDDRSYRSPRAVMESIAEIASKGGNLLLNIGPTARGEFPEPWYGDVLRGTGRWLSRQGESVYGTGPMVISSRGEPVHRWFTDSFKWRVAYTQRGDTLYAHVLRSSVDGLLSLPAMDGYRIARITLMDDGSDVRFVRGSHLSRKPDEWTVMMPRHCGDDDSVVTLEIRLEPETALGDRGGAS